MSTGSGLFSFFLDGGFAQNFGQIVSIRVKTFRNTNLAASRCFKMKKTSLPVDVHRSKPPLLNKRLIYRAGTSVEEGALKSNNCLDQWQSGKLSTGSRVKSFPRAFPSSTDVPVLLLNQPKIN